MHGDHGKLYIHVLQGKCKWHTQPLPLANYMQITNEERRDEATGALVIKIYKELGDKLEELLDGCMIRESMIHDEPLG